MKEGELNLYKTSYLLLAKLFLEQFPLPAVAAELMNDSNNSKKVLQKFLSLVKNHTPVLH